MAEHIEIMAKNMGLKIPYPLSDVEYINRRVTLGDHTPILIDDVDSQILDKALESYFGAPVAAATMSVPIDDDCVPPTPKPLVFDRETEKIRMKTNRDVFNETFGHVMFKLVKSHHLEDALTIETEDGKNMKFTDWLNLVYVEPKEEK
jgi:hypothetical protein